MIITFLFAAHIKAAPTIPTEIPTPDTPLPSPFPTPSESYSPEPTPIITYILVTEDPSEKGLTIALIVLVVIAVVGIIASLAYFLIKKSKGTIVASAEMGQEESEMELAKSRATMRGTAYRPNTTQSRGGTRASTRTTRSIYAVNTVIL